MAGVISRWRSKNLLAYMDALAPESWQEVTLNGTDTRYTKVRVHDSVAELPGVRHPFRQMILTGHGREKPAFIRFFRVLFRWQVLYAPTKAT